jgi:ATP-binding cassette subfamily C (CFTR/MRP) protein 1
VRSASEVEQNIVSVERMLQYIELKPEAPYEIPETQPEGVWPTEGRVEFRYFASRSLVRCSLLTRLVTGITHFRYRPELDLVLKSISFKLVWFAVLGYGGRTD